MSLLEQEISKEEREERKDFFQRHKVLFVFPESNFNHPLFFSSKHLGASYIRAFLKSRDIPTFQFLDDNPLCLSDLKEKILSENPHVLCVTIYDSTYYSAKMMIDAIKEEEPDIMIVVGGPTPTFSDRFILENVKGVDICVRGEGEYTLYEILISLFKGKGWDEIAGITYKKDATKIFRSPDRELITSNIKEGNLDIIPSPYLNRIISPQEGESVGIITSRGCCFKCVYCNFSAISRWTVRYHSVDRVIAEIKTIASADNGDKNKKLKVDIHDDAFTLNLKRAKEICRRLIKENLGLKLYCETRADTVDKELLELMAEAGFSIIHFGVESGSPRILREIKKVRSTGKDDDSLEPEKRFLKKVKENVKNVQRLGMEATVSIILGLPGETEKDGLESIEFIKSLGVSRYYHNYLAIFEGTELFTTHGKYGIRIREVAGYSPIKIYETEYAYNLDKIPMLKEEMLYDNSYPSYAMSKLLSGMTNISPQQKTGQSPQVVIFQNSIFFNYRSLEWLLENINFSTKIGFIWDLSPEEYEDGMYPFYEMYMPYQICHCLKTKHPNKDEEEYFKLVFEKSSGYIIPYKYLFLPFSLYDEYVSTVGEYAREDEYVFFSLDRLDEPQVSEEYIKRFFYVHNLLKRQRIYTLSFLDSCRWSKRKCPGVDLQRVIVVGNENLFPCFSGGCVGKVGDRLKDIKMKIRNLWEKERDERRCYECPIEKECSQCLFPYPITKEEFCGLKKRLSANLQGGKR